MILLILSYFQILATGYFPLFDAIYAEGVGMLSAFSLWAISVMDTPSAAHWNIFFTIWAASSSTSKESSSLFFLYPYGAVPAKYFPSRFFMSMTLLTFLDVSMLYIWFKRLRIASSGPPIDSPKFLLSKPSLTEINRTLWSGKTNSRYRPASI